MKVITFSRQFPKGHIREGQDTNFVEKILNSIETESNSFLRCVRCNYIALGSLFDWVNVPMSNDYDGFCPKCGATDTFLDDYKVKGVFDKEYYIGQFEPKFHTIRKGNRWKVGDWASLRVWSGKPYQSKQIEFAQVEIKKVWDFEIEGNIEFQGDWEISIDNDFFASNFIHCHRKTSLTQLAKNDGLTIEDFVSWFGLDKPIIKPFAGQIICWSEEVNY